MTTDGLFSSNCFLNQTGKNFFLEPNGLIFAIKHLSPYLSESGVFYIYLLFLIARKMRHCSLGTSKACTIAALLVLARKRAIKTVLDWTGVGNSDNFHSFYPPFSPSLFMCLPLALPNVAQTRATVRRRGVQCHGSSAKKSIDYLPSESNHFVRFIPLSWKHYGVFTGAQFYRLQSVRTRLCPSATNSVWRTNNKK